MKNYSELSREERIAKVMENRKNDFVLVLEYLAESNNISAILRTAEAFGVGKVCIIYDAKKPYLSKNTSSGASSWLNVEFFTSTKECFEGLKKDGFTLIGALVDPKAKILWEENYQGKIAIVVGNEANGLTEEAQQLMDTNVYLPMLGLTESLNVSTSAGIFLYEIIRQKESKND